MLCFHRHDSFLSFMVILTLWQQKIFNISVLKCLIKYESYAMYFLELYAYIITYISNNFQTQRNH